MNIGFDLDGIFIDKPLFVPKILIDLLYKKKSHSLSYRIPKKTERIIRKITHHPFFRPAISENIAFLKKLSQKKAYQYFLISGRFGFLEKETNRILRHHQLHLFFQKPYINLNNDQPHIFKNTMLKKLTIKRYIDDDLELITYLANHNPTIKFFWFNKKLDKKILKNLSAVTKLSKTLK